MISLEPEELGRFVAERAKRDPKVRALVKDVREFEGLEENASFQHLKRKITEQYEHRMEPLLRRMRKGERVSYLEAERIRYFIAGALFAVDYPEQAASNLEIAAKMAATVVVRDLEAEGSEAPNG